MVEILPESGGDGGEPSVWLLPIKAVPGARADAIAGPLGDRLKVRVSAPPEGGKANKAICGLIAKALGLRAGAVTVVRGATNPEKTLRIEGISEEKVRELAGES